MKSENKARFLRRKAKEIRILTLRAIASVGIGHIGGSLSIADLLAVLYFDIMNIDPSDPEKINRDKIVLSKGHAGPALYSALALRGYFDSSCLETLNKPGTKFPSHCDMRLTNGIDMTTGSLGQGASTACGLALAQKIDKLQSHTFLILGDGECQEGQVWEALMFAAHHKLDNLIAFIDYNGLQIDGPTDDICSLGDINAKLTSFGCFTKTINGHDVSEISVTVNEALTNRGKPSVIVIKTTKGKGVSLFENNASSHNAVVTSEILRQGLHDIEAMS
ncbi:MAG: transketolase [Eubacteriales bacterium]|jgi:transketolase|nr:transketolase [Eubacteriales bacterium]